MARAFRVRGVTEETEAVAGEGASPSGIVTFLFTDVESSTRLWAQDRDAMSASLETHDHILQAAFEPLGGYVFTTAGDSFAVAFSRASDAVAAALQAQEALAEAEWPGPTLKVRMGLHLGEAQERGGDYFGPVVNSTARLEAAGHGGQVLLTDPVRQAAEVTVKDLGVHQLRDVAEPLQVWQLGDGEFPPLRVIDPDVTNLPAAATSLVGRSGEVRRIREAVRSSRVVTLTAAGGTGKTRLSIAVGGKELAHRPDGVWFVDFTSVTDGSQVAPQVASVLGLTLTTGDRVDQVVEYLAGKDLLLILDNCEHVIDECAELAERFVARPGRSTLLATSRERLDIDGEQALQIPPLSVDDDDASAVELFAQRAHAVNSSFVLTDDNRPAVLELCARLDGMPLAIELAAARSTVMSPEELLVGIENRFQLLAGGRRRQRQRTLEATLDWSYDLLDDEEQSVFRSLGVFVATFDLQAVAAVAGLSLSAALDAIESLIGKSLVVREEYQGDSRFRLFETTTAYAAQLQVQAGESEMVRGRHLHHFLGLAQRFPAAVDADLAARSQLGADKSNLVAAFEWAASQNDWARASDLLLRTFTVFYDHATEGIALTERCLEYLDDHEVAMQLTHNLWWLHLMVSDYKGWLADGRWLRESPSLLYQLYGNCLLAITVGLSDSPQAQRIIEEAAAILETLPPGDDAIRAAAHWEAVSGMVHMYLREYGTALNHERSAIDLYAQLGYQSEMSAQSWMNEGVHALLAGDPHTALQSATHYSDARPGLGTGDELKALAYVALGELNEALNATRAYAHAAASGRVVQQPTDALLLLAVLADAEGDRDNARDLVLNMGRCRASQTINYALHVADQLGVSAEYQASQSAITSTDIKPRAVQDLQTLKSEMTRRGWL
ncbi:MAG: putative ATPase/class 3 adenylate cyclase [Myxococcota bacterium]